jgi:hypothetical protein
MLLSSPDSSLPAELLVELSVESDSSLLELSAESDSSLLALE